MKETGEVPILGDAAESGDSNNSPFVSLLIGALHSGNTRYLREHFPLIRFAIYHNSSDSVKNFSLALRFVMLKPHVRRRL